MFSDRPPWFAVAGTVRGCRKTQNNPEKAPLLQKRSLLSPLFNNRNHFPQRPPINPRSKFLAYDPKRKKNLWKSSFWCRKILLLNILKPTPLKPSSLRPWTSLKPSSENGPLVLLCFFSWLFCLCLWISGLGSGFFVWWVFDFPPKTVRTLFPIVEGVFKGSIRSCLGSPLRVWQLRDFRGLIGVLSKRWFSDRPIERRWDGGFDRVVRRYGLG